MKKLLFLLVATMFTVASFSQSTFIIRNQAEKFQKTKTTTNATATLIDSIKVAEDEAGLFEIKVIGYNEANSASYIGLKKYNYKKVDGVLTLPVAALDSIQVTGLTNAGFSLTSTAGNNPQIKVTGVAATTVKWVSITKQYLRRND